MDDDLFKYQCAEKLFDIKLIYNKELNADVPEVWLLSSDKEERQRKELNDNFINIITKPIDEVTDNDVKQLFDYRKELTEEVSSENSFVISISEHIKKVTKLTKGEMIRVGANYYEV